MAASAYEVLDWYETPRYYHAVFDEDSPREGTFLEAVVEEHGKLGHRRVLEPACGSGRLVAELARRGWRVTGTDLARAMLDFARRGLDRAGLRATLRSADMADFRERGSFELVHCLINSFRHLLTENAARAHLECVASALEPDGVYVLGLHLTDYTRTSVERERSVVKRGRTNIVCNIQGWPPDHRSRTEKVRSRLIIRERGLEKRSETSWIFRTYDPRQLQSLLRTVPALRHVATYDFSYDIGAPCELEDDQLDKVLVLKRC